MGPAKLQRRGGKVFPARVHPSSRKRASFERINGFLDIPPLPRRSGRAGEQLGVRTGRRRCSSGSCGAEPARLVTPKCAASSSPFPEPSSSKSKPSSTLCQRFKITRSHFSMERPFFFCVEAPPWQPCKAPGGLFRPVQNTTL